MRAAGFSAIVGSLALCLVPPTALGQDRLPKMPGYAAYAAATEEIRGLDRTVPTATPDAASGGLAFRVGSKWLGWDAKAREMRERPAPKPAERSERGRPGRGRQLEEEPSPDGKWIARYRDRNVVLVSADGKTTIPVTRDGSVAGRIKYGTASWVYGEELDQREAMWFSPDGKKLAYYRFDESRVPDYYLALGQGAVQDSLGVEAYPKAGAPNPVVDLYVYDLATKRSTRVDVRFSSFDTDLGHYVYGVRWLGPDRLMFLRMNRLQNALEICLADAATGAARAIHRETNPGGWVDYRPGNVWTDSGADLTIVGGGRKILWITEASGYRNLALLDIEGKEAPVTLTKHPYDVHDVLRVDEARGEIWYEARDGGTAGSGVGANLMQLHRVVYKGPKTGEDRGLTLTGLSHSVTIAPDGGTFADRAESWDTPPSVMLRGRDGGEIARVGAMAAAPFPPALRILSYSADGTTPLVGRLQVPKGEAPAGGWPLLMDVYGGPESGTNRERFMMPDPRTALGFAVAWLDGRGTLGRGRAFRQSVYRRLGRLEIDDQAAFARTLGARSDIDAKRVGISGVSYGGYASVMALLRYPDVFAAASAGSPVTDWRNYDSIYTERYMGLPSGNKAGYEAAAAATYAKDLKGRLLLFFGTADDNVHPSNTYQLIKALDGAGKSYDLAVGVDAGHSGVRRARELEFFVETLIMGRVGDRK